MRMRPKAGATVKESDGRARQRKTPHIREDVRRFQYCLRSSRS